MLKEISNDIYSFRLLTLADIPKCMELFNSYLGEGFFGEEELSKYILEPTRYAAGVFDTAGDMVSAITGAIVNNAELNKFVPEDFRIRIAHLVRASDSKNIGILKSMATHTTHQKQGLGLRLVQALTDWLKSAGVIKIVAFAWEDNSGCHVENVLNRAAYNSIVKFNDFWREDSIKHGYHCASCGNPCECSVVIFVKEFDISA